MSSKENAAVSQLLGLLESRYAMRTLRSTYKTL